MSTKERIKITKTYNRIYSKEKWEMVNKFNKKLLDDYMMQIKAEGKSEGSQKQYYNDARIIMIYILEELDNKPMYKLTRKNFRNMTLWMQENNLSSARINRMLSTTRNLLNYGMEDEDYEEEFEDCKANPNRIKGMQKEKKREIVFLNDEEIHIIYNALMEEEKYSQALLCALMYDSACRRNEAFQVKRSDIDLEGNFTASEVTGKRGKKFRLMYNTMTKEAFKKMEENRDDNHDTLWITRTGDPASYETLYAWVVSWREILKEATGEEKLFNAHSWRHSALESLSTGEHYIARGLNKKFDIKELKILAHHEDISTTDSYLKCKDEEKLLEAFGL